jgi:methicillin resistance protein
LQSFHEKTRYNIRLAIKRGVTVREGTKDDFAIFYNIMKETGKRDHFFIRNLSYFEKIYNIMYPGYTKLLMAEYENTPIAVAMPILYGNKVWYLYGGSSNQYRNLMPNYLLQWEMMKWALQEHCDFYDFRGVSGFKDETSQEYGIYRFKKGFNGDFIEFIDELEMVFSPVINTIWNITFRFYKMLYHIKENIMEGKKNFGAKKHKEKLSL